MYLMTTATSMLMEEFRTQGKHLMGRPGQCCWEVERARVRLFMPWWAFFSFKKKITFYNCISINPG